MMYLFKGRLQNLVMAMALLLATTSCGIFGSDDEGGNVEVKMHDAPALYSEVNVTIEEVEVKNESEGWVTISSGPTTVDVTTLINGKFATLAETNLSGGSYTQMRLIFGTDNSMKMSGENYNLELSSEAEEGVVVNINLNVDAQSEATMLLDFDLSQSIRSAVSLEGGFVLNPAITVKRAKMTGSISGKIDPAETKPWIYAMHNSDTVSSTLADTTNGEFKLSSLDEGAYDVYIEPTDTLYKDTTLTDVQVEARETNKLGTIEMAVKDTSSGSGGFQPKFE